MLNKPVLGPESWVLGMLLFTQTSDTDIDRLTSKTRKAPRCADIETTCHSFNRNILKIDYYNATLDTNEWMNDTICVQHTCIFCPILCFVSPIAFLVDMGISSTCTQDHLAYSIEILMCACHGGAKNQVDTTLSERYDVPCKAIEWHGWGLYRLLSRSDCYTNGQCFSFSII